MFRQKKQLLERVTEGIAEGCGKLFPILETLPVGHLARVISHLAGLWQEKDNHLRPKDTYT